MDSDLGLGWPRSCIRNWHQFGLITLKGQLVSNPGGHDALLRPEVYAGHRAASLYLAFLVSSLFSWTGSNALALRNHFCHHPWMGAPYMLLSSVLSLFILKYPVRISQETMHEPLTIRRGMQAAALGAVFCFSFVAVIFYREHGGPPALASNLNPC